jgi:hypothetical protein
LTQARGHAGEHDQQSCRPSLVACPVAVGADTQGDEVCAIRPAALRHAAQPVCVWGAAGVAGRPGGGEAVPAAGGEPGVGAARLPGGELAARIDDPLPPDAGQDPKRRLRGTLSNLNRGKRPVCISRGGTARASVGVCVGWSGRATAERRQRECSRREGRPDNGEVLCGSP